MITQNSIIDDYGRMICKTVSTSCKELKQVETGMVYGSEVVDIAGRYTYEEVGADDVTPEELLQELEAIL